MSHKHRETRMIQNIHNDPIPQEIDPESGLPIGLRVENARPAIAPERIVLEGRYARLEPLDPAIHLEDLYDAATPKDWVVRFRYLSDPPPDSLGPFNAWLTRAAASTDPLYFAVINRATGRAEGRQSLLRIVPFHQCIEIGHIYWGPRIAGTRVATEAMYLFAVYVLETLGYRRFEWKCDALNTPSRRAAQRFGFTYEGHFRRTAIIRNRSRDTAWFAMLAEEWPPLKPAYEKWLAPDNFNERGWQKTRLSELTLAALSRHRGKSKGMGTRMCGVH